MTEESLRKAGECSKIYSLRVNSNPDFPAQPLPARVVLQLTQKTPSYFCKQYHWCSKDFICHEAVQRVVTCRFCNEIKDCIVHIQAGLRKGKVLWATQQVYSVKPMACASEEWKFLGTGVEIVNNLGNTYPTHTMSRAGLILWQN